MANDFVFGGDGSQLMPLERTPVRMLSEDILIEDAVIRESGASGWSVRATYVFENPSDEALVLRVGFPEFRCNGEQDCAGDAFTGLETRVGGQVVPMGEGWLAGEHDWASDLGRVHTFEVPFEPRQTQKVVHTYGFAGSSSVWAEHPSYVTRTGSMWNGPIGRATFVIRTAVRPYGLTFPAEYKLLRYDERLEGHQKKRYVTEIVFEQRDWVPKADLEVELYGSGTPLVDKLSCPMMELVVEDAGYLTDPKIYLWKELAALSQEELRRCRNLPYAAHGYPFKDPALREIFYGPQTESYQRETTTAFFSRENPDFTPAMLNGAEWIYMRVMKMAEDRRRELGPRRSLPQ